MNSIEDEIVERIAQLLENLPSDYLYQPDLLTEDLVNEWNQLRKNNILIAQCWRSHLKNEPEDKPNYLLDEAVDKKRNFST